MNGQTWYRLSYSKYSDKPSGMMVPDPFDVDSCTPNELGYIADDVTQYHPSQFGWSQEIPEEFADEL